MKLKEIKTLNEKINDKPFQPFKYQSIFSPFPSFPSVIPLEYHIYNNGEILKKYYNKKTGIEYYFDRENKLIKEIDIYGVTTEYTYENNLLRTKKSSNNSIEIFNYDEKGRLIEQIDSDNYIIKYFYNEKDKLIKKIFTNSKIEEKYYYDSNDDDKILIVETIFYKEKIIEKLFSIYLYDENNKLIGFKNCSYDKLPILPV